jgi:hypothetical protein
MERSGPAPQSFIVKIWLEETAEESGQAKWRGHITHVPSGTRRYLNSMDDIITFISPYLENMGVKFRLRERTSRWLKPWKRYLKGQGWNP